MVATLINRTVIKNNQNEANVGGETGMGLVMAELDALSASNGIDSKTSMKDTLAPPLYCFLARMFQIQTF